MKKKLMRFNLAALALVMVTSVLISGTFAKYTTAVSAQDTALIAKWNISSGEMAETAADLDLFEHAYNEAIENNDGELAKKYILGPGVESSFEVKLGGYADVDAIIDLKIKKDDNSAKAPIQYAIETKEAKEAREGRSEEFTWSNVYYSEHLLAEAILKAMIDDDKIIANNLAGDEGKVEANKETNEAGYRPIIMKKTGEGSPVDKTIIVHWRWPFNVNDHSAYAEDMQYAGILTGAAWTDAMDTALGTASATADGNARTEYMITLTMKADQVTPTVKPAP